MRPVSNMSGQRMAARVSAVAVSALLYCWLGVIAFAPLPAAQAAESAKVPCTTGERGPGSEKQQLCLAKHIPGFGGYDEIGCTMIVYLTDLKQEKAARRILAPFSKAMLPRCGNRASLEIRKGQYEFAELSRWSKQSSHLLKFNESTKIPDIRGIPLSPFPENRIPLSVDKDETIPRVKQVLRDHDIPVEAFEITSREADRRALASVSLAPMIRRSAGQEEVVIPMIHWKGHRAAELVMGKTSLRETLRKLPPFPGHGPRNGRPVMDVSKAPAWASAEVRRVLGEIRYTHNPAFTFSLLGFDRNKRLVFVESSIMDADQSDRFAKELNAITTMREVHRESKQLNRRGKLGSCVIVETRTIFEEGRPPRVNSMDFFFTCKTRR